MTLSGHRVQTQGQNWQPHLTKHLLLPPAFRMNRTRMASSRDRHSLGRKRSRKSQRRDSRGHHCLSIRLMIATGPTGIVHPSTHPDGVEQLSTAISSQQSQRSTTRMTHLCKSFRSASARQDTDMLILLNTERRSLPGRNSLAHHRISSKNSCRRC